MTYFIASMVLLTFFFIFTAQGSNKTYIAGDGTAGMFDHFMAFVCFVGFVISALVHLVTGT